ncbi:uncharacterized protein LOC117336223 isoform X2 [Pecten maximus]|uniref:uncharacterized protein LOC117336223 isoform X2 n=1 Tax=Pecten maximus TaxID=6579 RepID=UPI001457E80A|nr:uncharacterized protein LOC117336223 isoform X2 [Pecten maximus]
MDSCFSEGNEYFVDEETTFCDQGTLTESLDKRSIGVLVKPHSLDACTADKESMTEPVPDYLENLIATQRELLHLRGDVCVLELKQQIHQLERNKELFQNMRGEPLDNIVDDRLTSLKIELNIIQNQVMSYDAHLAAGNVFKSVPQFTVSIPIGGQNMITVNKVLKQKSTKNAGTKRSFWDAYTPEEERSLRDLGTSRPPKTSNKDDNSNHPKPISAFQIKSSQTNNFTSAKRFGSDPSSNGIEDVTLTEDSVTNRKLGQDTSVEVTKDVTDVTYLKTDEELVLDMDDIDDISLPELSKAPQNKQTDLFDNTTTRGGDPVSDGVKNGSVKQIVNDSPVSFSIDSREASCESRVTSDFSATARTAFSTSDSVTENDKLSKLACRSASVMSTVNNTSTLSSSVLATETQNNNITTFWSGSSVVSKEQSSNITTSNGPTTVSSVPYPVPASYVPVSVCNASNSGSIMTNPIPVNTQRLASAQLTPMMTRPPLLATPRIIPGQQAVVLYPQGHPVQPNVAPYLPVRQSQPSLPPYRQVQPSILPYTQVLPGQATVPSFPVIANMRTPLLPQPPRVSTSVYQGNPLFHSPLTGQTPQPLGVVPSTIAQTKTSVVPSQTVSQVVPGQVSNLNGQQPGLPGHMNSTAVQEQRRGNSLVSSSNAMSCAVTSTTQTSKIAATLDRPSVDPELHQAVIMQLRQAYPNLAADPVWLETVGIQQTMVLQKYIDASKDVASDKNSNNAVQQTPNLDFGTDSQRKDESSRLPTASSSQVSNGDIPQTEVVLKQKSVIDENCAVIPRQPPGLASLADTDQSLSDKFENFPEISMKDLDGGTTSLVKTISDLTKLNRNESKDISPGEQKETMDGRTVVHKSSVGNKISQKPKSLLDNFKRVEKPVLHEPKVSTVYQDSFEKQRYSTSKDSDLDTLHSNLANNRSKNIPHRQMLVSESTKTSRETVSSKPKSVGGEDWEDDIDPNPKPFQHDFRKVRPAEKTKTSWMAEMSKTNLPPGLPSKKPTVPPTAGMNKVGSSGMAVIPLASKAIKTTSDLNCVSDGEGEDWHQVSKKKKEKKKSESERPRRKSGSDAPGTKSNNFEKLIAKLSEVFTTLSRERIIELITEVRNETKGLSGMNMKQIINMSRQVFMAKRHYYQAEPKQKHPSPTPTAQKSQRLSPLPIVGMTAMPGPGKTYNFKPLSMSVIQTAKDVPLMDDEEEICVICHDALLMEETKTLECGHVFHSACIKQWVFGQERTCPNCRRLALFPEEFPRLGK